MASTQLTVPAHIAQRMAARRQEKRSSPVLSAVVQEGGASFPKISIRAGRFRLVEDGVETPVGITLDVVIVGANPHVSKVFYATPYDGGEMIRPDCFSNDGIRPDPSVANPVSASCLDCPHNVLGSKITPSGAKSKLCNDQRHLAIVPAADPSKVYGLTVPVSSLKNLREYFKELQQFGLVPEEVVTELGFDDQVSYPKLTFKRKAFVPEKALPVIEQLLDSEEVKVAVRLIPPSGAPALAAPKAPVAAAALKAPKEEPEVEAEGEVEAAPKEEPQPVAKPARATKKAAESDTIAVESLEGKLDALFDE